MRLFETHCHLNDREAFPNPAASVAEAQQAGVERFVVIGIDLETSREALRLADLIPGVFATVGWHPNYVSNFDSGNLDELRRLLQHPKAVALGEIGLDYHWDFATPEQQMEALLPQLDLAAELGKPIIFHCRKAYDDLLGVLETRRPAMFVLHCFSGNEQDCQRAIALGAYFGIDGPITYPKAEGLRAIAAKLSKDRILIETDSPYLTPVPHRGQPNKPAYLPLVNDSLSNAIGVEAAKCAEITWENAHRFFGL